MGNGREGFEGDALCASCHTESRKGQVALWAKLGLAGDGEPKKGRKT